MKKKQVMALLLCGALTFGTGTTAMAADVQDTNVQDTTAADTEEETTPPIEENEPEYHFSQEKLEQMEAQYAEFIDQFEEDVAQIYEGLTEMQKAQLDEMVYENYLAPDWENLDEMLVDLRYSFSVEAMTEQVESMQQEGFSAEEINNVLNTYEDQCISFLDAIKADMQIMKDELLNNKEKYWNTTLLNCIKNLQYLIVYGEGIVDEKYYEQAQGYLKTVQECKYEAEKEAEIESLIDEVYDFIDAADAHLIPDILNVMKDAPKAYKAFLALRPEELLDDKAFDGAFGLKVIYGDPAEYNMDTEKYMSSVEHMEQAAVIANQYLAAFEEKTFADLVDYKTWFYGNMLAAYDGISEAILAEAEAITDKAPDGYAAEEKAAYEAAVAAYKATYETGVFADYAPAAEKIQKAAEAYVKAAEEEKENRVDENREKKTYALEKMKALCQYVDNHSDYFTPEFKESVDKVFREVYDVDINTISAKDMDALVAKVDELAANQSKHYSEKMKALIADSRAYVDGADKWWAFLSAEMQKEDTYAGAVALTDALEGALAAKDGIYDIDKLQAAYDGFKEDFNSEESKIHAAAKAAAQYVLEEAEKVYKEEAEKPHNEGVLEALKADIDALKAAIKEWDYAGARAVAEKTQESQEKVVNDKVEEEKPEKPEKPDSDKEDDKDDDKKDEPKKEEPKKDNNATANTGDTTDASTPGMFSLFSLAGIAAVLGKRRRS